MNSINSDNLYSILTFLSSNDLNQLSKTNKFINQSVKKNKKLFFKNQIIEKWGYNIYKLIIDSHFKDKDIIKFTKYNYSIFMEILELFYYKILKSEEEKFSSLLFIEIYDNIYNFTNSNDLTREYLFNHRTIFIRKYYNFIKIKNNNKINFILNSTCYLNRFCSFLGRQSLNNNDILKIINFEIY